MILTAVFHMLKTGKVWNPVDLNRTIKILRAHASVIGNSIRHDKLPVKSQVHLTKEDTEMWNTRFIKFAGVLSRKVTEDEAERM